MKNLVFVIAILFCSISSQRLVAQDNNSEVPHIEVIGTAENNITPDMIYVRVSLTEKTVGKKRMSIAEQETKFFQIINNLEIDAKNVTLSEAISQIIQRRQRDKGTKISKDFTVLLTSAKQVSDFFEQLTVNGIREAYVTKTDHSDIINIRKQVRIDAVKAAKAKAIYLTEAIGYRLGLPLEIRAQTQANAYRQNFNSGSNVAYSLDSFMPDGVEYDQVKVVYSYYIKFAIEN